MLLNLLLLNFLRNLHTVDLHTPNALIISSSLFSSFANNKTRARFIALADFLPCFTYFSNSSFALSLNLTLCILFGISASFLGGSIPNILYMYKLYRSRTSRFVKDDDLRITQERPGQRHL